ncbi:MAG: DUF3570 domain-containing protein [Methylococcales bacterium]
MAVIKARFKRLLAWSKPNTRRGERQKQVSPLRQAAQLKPMPSHSLQALTAAALSLPGLMLPSAQAADNDEATFQYGYYQEGKRDLNGYNSKLDPIHVDSLNTSAMVTLFDRVKLGFNYVQDTWSGATPLTTVPSASMRQLSTYEVLAGASGPPLSFNMDSQGQGYQADVVQGGIYSKASQQPVHMVVSASPETRKQTDFNLGYEWDEASLKVGGGVSVERDYESRFGNINSRWDFNQKLTTLNLGMSYTASDIHAVMPDAYTRWIFAPSADYETYYYQDGKIAKTNFFHNGKKEDWSANIGLTQVLSKNAVLEGNLGYTHSAGYLENPYKAVTFVFDSERSPNGATAFDGTLLYTTPIRHYFEQRPDVRNQWTWSMSYVQHINLLDAALHLDYRFYHDDWGINAHTFEAAWAQPLGYGWSVTPRVRYYTQEAADFYKPFFVLNQPDADSYKKLPIRQYSSDHRLSGYGTLSGGVTVSKQFAKGITLEAGGEYYTHNGSLKLGGGGEGRYADFNYYLLNAQLKVNLATAFSSAQGEHSWHIDHSRHGAHAPAGVMFDHTLNAGQVMLGYRYMYGLQQGNMLHGTQVVTDKAIVAGGCGSAKCFDRPNEMNMNMHMLEIMYAPTDWLTLMVMPQFMDMNMNLVELDGAPTSGKPGNHGHGASQPSIYSPHETGGIGDTGLYALIRLFTSPVHHLTTSIGVSAPTGESAIRLSTFHSSNNGDGGALWPEGDFIHYGMQLGSGTWDFKPSVTYAGHLDKWSWGAQVNGTKRMQTSNSSGYALGDVFQGTFWGGYSVTPWLSATLRGIYTLQGAIKGKFSAIKATSGSDGSESYNPSPVVGPMDMPGSYGGRYWDVGFGISATVPDGNLQGNRFALEWLQPVSDDVNGYQLERAGALSANWSYAF